MDSDISGQYRLRHRLERLPSAGHESVRRRHRTNRPRRKVSSRGGARSRPSPVLIQGQSRCQYPSQMNRTLRATSPDGEYIPSHLSQGALHPPVAFFVRPNFLGPKIFSCRGEPGKITPRVPVPKTAVYENGEVLLRNNYVGRAGQLADVTPETDSMPSKESFNLLFWEGICPPHPAHQPTALRFCEGVGHLRNRIAPPESSCFPSQRTNNKGFVLARLGAIAQSVVVRNSERRGAI
jgi:hypothetical protein